MKGSLNSYKPVVYYDGYVVVLLVDGYRLLYVWCVIQGLQHSENKSSFKLLLDQSLAKQVRFHHSQETSMTMSIEKCTAQPNEVKGCCS